MTPWADPSPGTWVASTSWSQTSMMAGWLPSAIQLVAALVLIAAVSRRGGTWWRRRVPAIVVVGACATTAMVWILRDSGAVDLSAPFSLWVWTGLTTLSITVLFIGWLGTSWWRRVTAVLAVPLCALATVVVFNTWVGYARTVEAAWKFATGSTPPNQIDLDTARQMARDHVVPQRGRLVPVSTGSNASGFHHRGELVYLPPVWFSSVPPPPLPVVMMIGGEFGSSADWIWAGNAQKTADDFAQSHGGSSPVLVFPDKGGAFNKDTECVNGSQGNAADHLVKDVVPFVVSTFGTSVSARDWAVAGWSMGGTCAVLLTTRHPDVFATFVDIEGDAGPTAGTRQQTIDRLFDGSEDAWAAFDPATVMRRHGPYDGLAGIFVVEEPDRPDKPSRHLAAAQQLSTVANEVGISNTLVEIAGKHDWPTGAAAFEQVYGWLAGRLRTPGVAALPMPGDAASP